MVSAVITSFSNFKIKNLKKLMAKRDSSNFVVEGTKEIDLAILNGFEVISVFTINPEFEAKYKADFNLVSDEILEKLSYRSRSSETLAIFRRKSVNIKDLKLDDNPLIIVADKIEKPGNLGALLRTADGVKATAVILTDSIVDIFNPNVIRSSVGTIFSNQIATATFSELSEFAKANHINLYSAYISDNSINYVAADLSKRTAIVVGNEHDGLEDYWLKITNPILIPMLGDNDSLNVSVACAVICYEAIRQRNS